MQKLKSLEKIEQWKLTIRGLEDLNGALEGL
jgi:hypothetical protein